MACVVVFCTVTALIRPAMTLEQAFCEKTEHTHTAECYTQLTSVSRRVPVCGCTDFVVHQHDAACYGEDGALWCTLPEVEAHSHDAGCYAVPEAAEAHTHTDGCYTLTQGDFVCTEHVHTDECYTESRNLQCTLEECDGHLHDDSCRDEAGELVCGQEESEGHHHTEGCFAVQRELTCGNPGDHGHTEGCYEQVKTLICDLPEQSAESAEPADPVLICEKPEVILHEHGLDCLDENGSVICGQEQVLQHQHMDACFETVEEPVDTEALTCTSTDPEHIHGPLCYGSWVLSCELEEHTHSEECLGEPTEPEEPTDGALTQDGAVVSELNVNPVLEEGETLPWMVRSGQSAVYRISIKTASYTDAAYTQGRVRLELVLPLSAEEAAFDLTAMSWLDQTEGYAPQITEETRALGDEEVPCQVLTGYVLLTAIPGAFSEDAVIQVLAAAPEKTAALQVSAAMEHNQWDGDCELHQMPEKLTVTAPGFMAVCSEEEAKGFYAQFLLEIEALEAAPDAGAAEALMERLRQAFQLGQLTQEGYAQLYERLFTLLYGSPDTIAEQALGSNWMLLRDSGWFEAYSGYSGSATAVRPARAFRAVQPAAAFGLRSQMPSDVQVCDRGGTNANVDDGVSVSKTIAGTELENVFDITLRVQTNQKISEITSEPDMAVVIVMDISNTMNSNFGGVTRYAAAMTAADNFLDQFAANNALGTSKVGFVSFNTNAQQIFALQSCADQAQANALKDIMRTRTGNIINAAGYNASHSRFTNIEAGLALASDMLSGVGNKNKFIIFLSDGFPTTYISSGYSGYDPYGNQFYDRVLNKPCTYGTSYSDMAAFMAQSKAAAIKGSGTTIFSIGVDVGGQTIQTYITQSEKANGFSVVDRDTTSYVIGDANSSDSYKNWLRESIGSGYYYDSTDSSGLSSAFDQIFAEIKREVTEASKADWVAADPMPSEYVEFIRFYDQSANLTPGPLTGTASENGENTASFDGSQNTISWDLKHSGYQSSSDGSTTTYTYQLVYRVRLANELAGFTEGSVYDTNGSTTLRYRVVRTVDDSAAISDPKTLAFLIPSVQGYLSQLTFTKQNGSGTPLQGAEFTLRHDARSCSLCRGDGTSVAVAEKSAVSGTDGSVTFTAIPSGHRYTLTETKAPDGYAPTGNTYQVTVAYDSITVDVTDINGGKLSWDGTVTNNSYYELPDTGGAGTTLYTMGGRLLLAAAAYLLLYRKNKLKTTGKDLLP